MSDELKVGDVVYGKSTEWGWRGMVTGPPRTITRETKTLWITDEGTPNEHRWKKAGMGLSLYDDKARADRKIYQENKEIGILLYRLGKFRFDRPRACTPEVANLLRLAVKILSDEELSKEKADLSPK